MKMKSGKWLADWRDASGVRHRKAFASKSAARRYQHRKHTETLAAKKGPRHPRPKASRAGGRQHRRPTARRTASRAS